MYADCSNICIKMIKIKTCVNGNGQEQNRKSLLNKSELFGKRKKVKVAQSYQSLCDPMDCIVHGLLQARILQWVAFPFSRGSSQPRD